MNRAEKCISPFNEDEISVTPVFTAPVSPFPTLPAPPAHFRPAEPEAVQHEPKSPLILANWFRVRRLTRDKCGKPKWRRLPTVPPRWYSRNSTKESSIASIFKPFHTVALDIIGYFEFSQLAGVKRQASRQGHFPTSDWKQKNNKEQNFLTLVCMYAVDLQLQCKIVFACLIPHHNSTDNSTQPN
ncbi:hypothetical protein T12_2279 [Trichinella patagoniensis]|uniref:Uncharacterized protein n=1 Tax=Trichinella patagoniensis TaxID=990121 RepID=A0A0V0ZLS9_9BILA|nr:hypothetical protein T12_2279 [Trichinella patagoniensis]